MSRIDPSDYFSAMEIEEFREIFEIFDKDGGGSISADELLPILSTLGKRPSPEELDKLVKEIDEDGSGEIDFDEFLLMLIYMEEDNVGLSKDQLGECFNKIDKEGKGFISLHDLEELFSHMSSFGGTFLEDLEKDPDASIKDRAIPWDEYYNRLMMGHAHGLKAKDNLPTSKTELSFDQFCLLVENLEM